MSDSDKERFRCGACNSRICVCAITITGGITRAEVVERTAKGSPAAQAILATDKAPPKGALETAVDLCDDLIVALRGPHEPTDEELYAFLRRRAALTPLLAAERPQKASALAQCGPDGWPEEDR